MAMHGAAASAATPDIVLSASDALRVQGNWHTEADATTARGRDIESVDRGWSTVNAPVAAPADFFELTFSAPAHVPYHVWVRMRAASNSKWNDSVWAQFSDTVDTTGTPRFGIGTGTGLLLNLATNSAANSLDGWGWVDGAYWLTQPAVLTFATSGIHTVRIQTREDGAQIDQIVFSAGPYLSLAPGPPSGAAPIISIGSLSTAPFTGTPVAIPGAFQSVDFDEGGEGGGYHDSTPGNSGGQYRSTDVDIEASSLGGYNVGWIAAGEWLTYSVNVASSGTYVLSFQVASPSGGGVLHARIGSAVTPAATVPNTGSWQTWTTISTTASLTAGPQALTLMFDTAGFNVARVTITPSDSGDVTIDSPAIITLLAGGNLQAAIDAARPGDTIALEPGATFVGNFILRAKSGTGVITIRSAASDGHFPNATSRINPSYAPYLPKIKSPDSAPAMRTEPGAHDYRLMFLEFQANPAGYYDILDLGDGSAAQNSLAQVPHDLVVDRIYMHGDPVLGQKRGIALNSASTTVSNSYISDIKAVGQDSQAVGGYNGPGPFTIVNNYLEAAGENIIFGGADPPIPNLIPSNITITGNYITKPLSWRGQSWSVKNGLELKSAAHVLIDHNVIENTWLASQVGTIVLFTVRDQDGAAPWSTITDVTFSNNVVRHAAGFVNILGYDDNPVAHPSVRMNGLRIVNNLVYDINPQLWNDPVSGAWGSGRMMQIIGGPQNVEIAHNTMVSTNPNMSPWVNSALSIGQIGDTYQTSGLWVHDNVIAEGDYGVIGDTVGIGRVALDTYAPGSSWVDNLLIRGASGGFYDSFYPATTTVSPAGATVIDVPTMTVASPFQALPTTDAQTIGANMTIIRAGIPDLDLTR